MNGILAYMDWSILVDKPLEPAKKKFSLQKEEGLELVFSNRHCSIKFWDSDYQAFSWVFYDPNAEHVYYYDVFKYAYFILNIEIPKWTNPNKIDTLEEFTVDTFKYYNDIIIDFLDMPLKGDFTWHERYVEKYKVILKLSNYAYGTTNLHSSERREITKSYRRAEPNSKEALLDHLATNYPNNGAEFEVLHEDNSIHQLMEKYELQVPFYFSYNDQLYKVVSRSFTKDFGQIYLFSKFYNRWITPIRCDLAIQSKAERIEILSKRALEGKVKLLLNDK